MCLPAYSPADCEGLSSGAIHFLIFLFLLVCGNAIKVRLTFAQLARLLVLSFFLFFFLLVWLAQVPLSYFSLRIRFSLSDHIQLEIRLAEKKEAGDEPQRVSEWESQSQNQRKSVSNQANFCFLSFFLLAFISCPRGLENQNETSNSRPTDRASQLVSELARPTERPAGRADFNENNHDCHHLIIIKSSFTG